MIRYSGFSILSVLCLALGGLVPNAKAEETVVLQYGAIRLEAHPHQSQREKRKTMAPSGKRRELNQRTPASGQQSQRMQQTMQIMTNMSKSSRNVP